MAGYPVKIIDELDPPFCWDPIWEKTPFRDRMPTLRDFDPLRHDLGSEGLDRVDPPETNDVMVPPSRSGRDSMPTLPDLDPLRHDLPC